MDTCNRWNPAGAGYISAMQVGLAVFALATICVLGSTATMFAADQDEATLPPRQTCSSTPPVDPEGPVDAGQASAPELIATGIVTIHCETMRGGHALADVPGLFERLDISDIHQLWPGKSEP